MPKSKQGTCPLCQRNTALTFHHLIPRKVHRRAHFKKHFSKTELNLGIQTTHPLDINGHGCACPNENNKHPRLAGLRNRSHYTSDLFYLDHGPHSSNLRTRQANR